MLKKIVALFAALAILVVGAVGFTLDESKIDGQIVPFDARRGDSIFTGVGYVLYPDYRPRLVRFFWRGKQTGHEWRWHANGKLAADRRFSQGREEGEQRGWYPDGRVRWLSHFVSGEPHGEMWEWHANGQVAGFSKYEAGREMARKSWTANGTPFYNYVHKNDERVGILGDGYCDPKEQDRL